MLERMFLAAWYGPSKWTYVFWPLMLLYRYVVTKKRNAFLLQGQKSKSVPKLPVIVVGNITVGGTGKTPITQSIVRYLKSQGYKPGIISRGYGGALDVFPHSISRSDESEMVGDEPYMLFHSLNVPVVIDPVRINALSHISSLGVDVVISDDGLQHYALPRDIEICVLDGFRGLGNQQLLPVGPLREPVDRLKSVDFTLESARDLSNDTFVIQPVSWVNVKTGQKLSLHELQPQRSVAAIAGIGNPDKFFHTLIDLGVDAKCIGFPDHHAYVEADLENIVGQVLMTEKDAVKIRPFSHEDMWYLEIEAKLSGVFYDRLSQKLNEYKLMDKK